MSEVDLGPEIEVPFDEDAISDQLRLPVGAIGDDGMRYRDVVIDEMIGIDDHNIASKKTGKNAAKGITVLISRCVQEVEGLIPKKKNPEKMLDRSFARKLTIVDRDFLLTRIHMVSGEKEVVMAGVCPRCNEAWEEPEQLANLPLIEWPDDAPLELEFELPRGYIKDGKTHKKGKIRFPTGKEQEMIGAIHNPAEIFDALFASCLIHLGDLTSFNQEMMKRMKASDRRYLMRQLQRSVPGLRQWKTVKCDCGREFDIHADLTSFFDGGRKSVN
jgi:hypothetical protein